MKIILNAGKTLATTFAADAQDLAPAKQAAVTAFKQAIKQALRWLENDVDRNLEGVKQTPEDKEFLNTVAMLILEKILDNLGDWKNIIYYLKGIGSMIELFRSLHGDGTQQCHNRRSQGRVCG